MERGEKTSQYRANKSNYAGLVSSLEPVLGAVTAECFEKDLISSAERVRANNQRELKSDRSGGFTDTED